MAPEQITKAAQGNDRPGRYPWPGRDPLPHADRQAPYQGATVLETLDQVQRQEPVPPRRLIPAIPRDLETICLKCLDKNPAGRYASAEALADDLQPLARRPADLGPAGLPVERPGAGAAAGR